ncbi:hypothetical protein [Actinomadura flavalba]|uniref:hypothetical protein n=1 Tax=Actinomadura flavalba TaxID=1120938 RepID=UPI00036D5AA3|nr:hypothetical protein [Actinomadura flavalba]
MLPTLPEFDADEAYWREVARLLFGAWAARTGRTLPHVPVSHLERGQLERFWCDDRLEEHHEVRNERMHTSLAAVDIIGFGAQPRDADLRRRLRATMYGLLRDALNITGLPLDRCYREDRGDGALIVFPAGTDPVFLLDPLAHHLAAVVRRENRYAGQHSRLRLRLAVHHGHVVHDEHGVTGDTSLELFRLLDARSFKAVFEGRPDAEVGLIVPDRLFVETTGRGGLITPEAYQEIRVISKGTRIKARVWLPPAHGHGKAA